MIESLRSYSLALYVMLYVVSSFVLEITGINTTIQKIFCLVMFIIFTIMSKYKVNNMLFLLRFIVSIIVLLMLQFIFCEPHTISVRMIINIILVFFIALKKIPQKSLMTIFTSLKISALIIALDVFYLYLSRGFYVRDEALIDKSLISAVFALCFMICWIDLILKRHRYLNIIIIAFTLYVDLFIVISKTSIFAAFCFIIITYFCMKKEDRYKYLKTFRYLFIIFCLIMFIFPDVVLLDDFKETINAIAGHDVYQLNKVKAYDTFNIRGVILQYSMNLFLNHPIIGIGIGNFAYYNHSFFSELDEPESSMLAIITEGGIYYSIVMIIFYFYLFKKSFLRIRETLGYEECLAFGLPFVYFIICFGNDFMDTLYWIMMGISYSILYVNIKRRIINKEQNCDL